MDVSGILLKLLMSVCAGRFPFSDLPPVLPLLPVGNSFRGIFRGALNSSQGPALTSSNGKVVMAWKGVEGDQRLFWASISDRGDWDGPYSRAKFNASQGPALAVL